MQCFDVDRLVREQGGRSWQEFLRVPALSMGIYHLEVGQADLQQPHTEDEVYYVLKGHARFRAADQELTVQPGQTIFVERLVAHRFFDITEALTLLVFFAPSEGTQKGLPEPTRT